MIREEINVEKLKTSFAEKARTYYAATIDNHSVRREVVERIATRFASECDETALIWAFDKYGVSAVARAFIMDLKGDELFKDLQVLATNFEEWALEKLTYAASAYQLPIIPWAEKRGHK